MSRDRYSANGRLLRCHGEGPADAAKAGERGGIRPPLWRPLRLGRYAPDGVETGLDQREPMRLTRHHWYAWESGRAVRLAMTAKEVVGHLIYQMVMVRGGGGSVASG